MKYWFNDSLRIRRANFGDLRLLSLTTTSKYMTDCVKLEQRSTNQKILAEGLNVSSSRISVRILTI
jgi:hypothetical protein